MRTSILLLLFALLLAGAGTFLNITTAALPERLASHFDAAGKANGYMSREGFFLFMLAFTIGVPIFLVSLTGLLPHVLSPMMINIPHRMYWLAPERRKTTIDFLTQHAIWLGCILVVFLCCVDWLVICANTSGGRPQLPVMPLAAVIVLFFTALGFWTWSMFRRFGKVPK